jgi:hypothetical protein
MAVSQIAAPAVVAVPGGPGALTTRRDKDGRAWVGQFLIPQGTFLLGLLCPICDGAALCDEGDIRCLLCSRELRIVAMTTAGRVLALSPSATAAPTLVRVQTGLSRRTNRHLSKIDGLTGLCARIFKLVPPGPHDYVVVETLAVALQVHREDVRAALSALVDQGLVEPFTFAQGYRTGWRRVTSPPEDRP